MFPQFFGVGVDPGGGHHHRDDGLAPLRILDADHSDLVDVRVLDKDVFDFGGGDVLPAADDGVIGAPGDEQVAGLVQGGDVLGREPALLVEHRPDAGVVPRNLFSANEQLAGLTCAEDGAVVIADLHLDTGHRLTDRPQPFGHRLLGMTVRLAVVIGGEHRDGRATSRSARRR